MKLGTTVYTVVTTPATVTADANGSATVTFVLPGVPAGRWTIESVDSYGNSASATLTITSKLALSADTGSAGDTISVLGTGFGAGKIVTFTYNGAALPSSASSDANGTVTYQFTVPETAAGAIELRASDGTNVVAVNFTATAKASVSTSTSQSSPGNVGMDFTVSGTGFKANTNITITF
jgi:hypothetical protein